jgi:hypothetical protein
MTATDPDKPDLGELYDEMVEAGALSPGEQPFRQSLYDPQLCSVLDLNWLMDNGRSLEDGTEISRDDIRHAVDAHYIRQRCAPNGKQGFIVFALHQISFLQKLRGLHRYATEEIQHIMKCLDDLIDDTVLEFVPYDDSCVSDFQHFLRRIREQLDDAAQSELSLADLPVSEILSGDMIEQQLNRIATEKTYWQKLLVAFDRCSEATLSRDRKVFVGKKLMFMRLADEMVRMSWTDRFEAQILKGYSPEVEFRGWTMRGSEVVELRDIDWECTLNRYRRSRACGRRFPLHTPLFDLSDRGLEITPMTPDNYREMYSQYRMKELAQRLERIGPDLWEPPELPDGMARCVGCEAIFPQNVASKKYCNDRCRKSANHRAWRRRNPERYRQAQADYYSSVYD